MLINKEHLNTAIVRCIMDGILFQNSHVDS